MTQHNHSERVDGCFRCDLSADEVTAAATTAKEVLRTHLGVARETGLDDEVDCCVAELVEHDLIATADRDDRIGKRAATAALRKAADEFATSAGFSERLSRGVVAALLRDMAHLIDMGDDGLTDSERQRLADEWAACEGSAMTVEQYRQTREGK